MGAPVEPGGDRGEELVAACIPSVDEPTQMLELEGGQVARGFELGAEALVEALTLLAAESLTEVPQNHELATFAPKVDRATARIDWARTAQQVEWHIRGMDAVPGAWSEQEGQAVKLFRPTAQPGGAMTQLRVGAG